MLRDPGRSRAHPTGERLERREGCFALDEIGLPAVDHGGLYGDAAFEGVLVAHGRLFTWREHLARLHQSCERLDIAVPVGLTGIWLFLFARNLRSRALLPVNDPYFKEAVANGGH